MPDRHTSTGVDSPPGPAAHPPPDKTKKALDPVSSASSSRPSSTPPRWRASAPTSGWSRRCTSSTSPTRRAWTRHGTSSSPTTGPAAPSPRPVTGSRPRRPPPATARASRPGSAGPRPPRGCRPSAGGGAGPAGGPGDRRREAGEGREQRTAGRRPEEQARREHARSGQAGAGCGEEVRVRRRRGRGPKQTPLRGAAASVVKNMNASLTVPTATSVRAVPAKLLADNRIVINNHLARARGRQGLLHPPDRLRAGPGAGRLPEHEQRLRRGRRQAGAGAARARQLRAGHRPAQARRLPLPGRGVHQGRRGRWTSRPSGPPTRTSSGGPARAS